MNPVIRPWRQVFDFSGRATRTEYGLYHLTFFGFCIAMEAVTFAIGMAIGLTDGAGPPSAEPGPVAMIFIGLWSLLWLVIFVVFVIGHISIAIRRLHDHGDPGAKYLLTFIPLVGIVFWAMLVFTRGDDFENDYGPDPRHPEGTTEELGGVFS